MTIPANNGRTSPPAHWPRALWIAALALLAGAAYLAVTRADALMLDIARIAGCF